MAFVNSLTSRFSFGLKKCKLLCLAWLVVFLAAIAALAAYYYFQADALQEEAQRQLQSVTHSKVNHIDDWLAERQKDLETFTNHKNFLEKIAKVDLHPEFQSEIQNRIEAFVQAYNYGRFSFIDAQGRILFDVGELTNHTIHEHTQKLIEKANATGELASQLFWHEGIFHYDVVAKLVSPDDQQTHLGNIILHIDPTDFLIPFVDSWPVETETGISHLVFQDESGYAFLACRQDKGEVTFVYEPIKPDSAMALYLRSHLKEVRFPINYSHTHGNHSEEPSSHTFIELNVETSSHHAGEIFVYHHHIENVDWILLSHIDKSEVYAPLYRNMIVVSLVLILALALLVVLFRNVQQKEIERIKLKQMEASRAYFMELFTGAPVAYCLLDHKGQILEVNEAWTQLTGYEKPMVLGRYYDFLIEESSVHLPLESLLVQDSNQSFELIIHTANGERREVIFQTRTSFSADASQIKIHCILINVTEQRQTEKRLRLAAKVYAETGEGIMVTTADLKVVMVNNAFTRILGYQPDEVIGKTPAFIKSGRHDAAFYQDMWQVIETKGIWQGEIWNRHKTGYVLPEWLTITELRDEQGEVENYVGVFADITQLKESESKLDYLAHYDVLTGLINRRRFVANLDYAIAHAKRDNALLAVLVLGLDRFKDVNDSFGHGVGDEVLIKASQLLQETIREADSIARLGGDQFVVLLEDLHSHDDAARVADKFIQILSEPFSLDGNLVVSVGCSIGISLFPSLATRPEELMQQADSALYLAKKKGRGSYEYFSVEMTQHALQRMAIESELKLAVRHNELRVFYQPQVDFDTGKIKGVEALVRWQHPNHGLQYPGYFIAVAEESGLTASIGEWVLKETCRQAKHWNDQGFPKLVYAVNISSKQMVYSDLCEMVLSSLEESGLPPEQLELEITESTLMEQGQNAVGFLEYLRGLGVRIAIDDFGTGYSSLAYLKSLPLDVLKIDKSFIDDIPGDETGMQIVNTIISMAHNLHLEVLAEGVENETQQRYLQLKGCDYFQGYLTSAALPPDEFAEHFLKKTH